MEANIYVLGTVLFTGFELMKNTTSSRQIQPEHIHFNLHEGQTFSLSQGSYEECKSLSEVSTGAVDLFIYLVLTKNVKR